MRLLSGDQEMSLMGPANGWYSYFNMCSFWVVSQIRNLPDTSVRLRGREQRGEGMEEREREWGSEGKSGVREGGNRR